MKKLNQKGFGAVEILLIVVLVGVLAGAGWFVWRNNSSRYTPAQITDQASQQTPSQSTSEESNVNEYDTVTSYGTIKGNASYPSEGLREDQEVCAVSVSDSTKIYCDKEVGARFTKQAKNACMLGDSDCNKPAPSTSYTIKVPAGKYYVYSTAEKSRPGYKAYYNEYSKCGLSEDCPASGHKKYIIVTVEANKTVKNIDPGDWYAN